MSLFIPKSRVCPGKTTQYPVTHISPILWLKTSKQNYVITCIDGFIITGGKSVNGIFKKFEYEGEPIVEALFIDQITRVLSEDEILLLKELSNLLRCGFYVFIWPRDFPEGYDISSPLIHAYSFTTADQRVAIKENKLVTISGLEAGIKKLRGFSFSSVKNLNSASSNVECYLANQTHNPWPGDIDAIVYDKQNNRFPAIIEFKTHNKDTPIQGEHIGKYGAQDWRRFDVLFDLTDNFYKNLGYRPKIIFIVWGTNPNSSNHSNLKIDVIERNKVIKTYFLPRPTYNQFSEELFTLILEIAHETTI